MQFKTAMRYYYIPIRSDKIQNKITECWQGSGESEITHALLLGI